MKFSTLRVRGSLTGAAALLLAACGGGGGDSAPTTPSTPTPPAPSVRVTLRGVVTDAPIANAAVSVSVGGQTFQATADADGNYELQVEVPQSLAGEPVVIGATGAGEQQSVRFESLPGSLASLVASAGGDGVLDAQENLRTNVTNVSTAESALLREANGGTTPPNDDQLQALRQSIDAADLLNLAAAIKLIVDDPAYVLPEGVSDTLAFASSMNARNSFVEAVQANAPEDLQAALSAIVADPALTAPVTAAELPPLLYAALFPFDVRETYNATGLVSGFAFDAGGSGTYFTGSFTTPMTWTLEGARLRVAFAQTQTVESFETRTVDGAPRQVRTRISSDGLDLALLGDSLLSVTQTETYRFPENPELADETHTTTSGRTLLLPVTSFGPFLRPGFPVAGDVVAAPLYLPQLNPFKKLQSDVLTLGSGGAGTAQLSGKTFSWAVEDDGHQLTIAQEPGVTLSYRLPLGHRTGVDQYFRQVLVEAQTPQGRFVELAYAATREEPLVIDEATLPGTYYQFGVGEETALAESRLLGFRLRFAADRTGYQGADFIDGASVVATDNAQFPVNFFRWGLSQAGVLELRRHYDSANPGNRQCDPATLASCTVWDARDVIPFGESARNVYVVERRRFTDGVTPISDTTPTDYTLRFYTRGDADRRLVGTWEQIDAQGQAPHRNIATFTEDGRFLLATNDNSVDCEDGSAGSDPMGNGIEFGRYAFDQFGGQLQAFDLAYDTNGHCGLHDAANAGAALSATFDTAGRLVLADAGGSVMLRRVPSEANSLTGAWGIVDDPSTPVADVPVVLFFPDGVYYVIQQPSEAEAGNGDCANGGIERGTYAYNATSGQLSVPRSGTTVDGNGDCGLSDPAAAAGSTLTLGVQLAQDGRSFTANDGTDTATFNKLTSP